MLTSDAFADWRPTGPFGGDAELVRVVPKMRGLVIAGAHNGLLFSSTNGGASWSNIPFDGQLTGVLHALEVDPRSTGTWYAGMEGDHPWMSGVYKTVDAGESWRLLPGTRGKAVWALALWPTNPDVIAAGTGDGVYRSQDAGENWSQISEPGNAEFRPVVSLAFHPSDRDVIYAGTTHLPWRTSDGGASWESIHTGMIDDSDVFSIQVDAHQPASVYASACSGLYQSSDSAGHWNKLPTPKGAFRTWFVALDPRHSGVVFAGTTEGLLRSEDGGKIWRVVSTDAVRSIAFDPNVPERVFFASTTSGMMVSTDGGRTLRDSNFGFANRNFTALADARGVLYLNSVFEGSGGVYRTENFGLRWQRAGGEPAGQEIRLMTAAPDLPGTLFAAGYHGLLQSKDFGKTWARITRTAGGRPVHVALAALPHECRCWPRPRRGFSGAIRRRGLANGSGRTLPGGISSLELSGRQTIAAVSGHGAFASTDAGVTWRACGEPAPSAVWYGFGFLTTGKPSHTALAATSAGLFRSTDDCGTWTRAGGDLAASTIGVVLFHPTRAGEAFASQDGRILRSIDEGQHWLPLDDDTDGKVWPVALVVLPELPDRLYALFPRRGVSFNAFDPRRVEVAQFNQFAAPKL